MTFNASVPNNGQSPGDFPAQNRTNMQRIKAIIDADHIFNDTAAPTDGVHKKWTMVNLSPDPTSLPDGTNAIGFTKTDTLGKTQLYFYNGDTTVQITPTDTVLSGTVTVNHSTYVTISAIPVNVFGEVFLWKGRFAQSGIFVSDGAVVNGYSLAEKYVVGSPPSEILRLGFDTSGADFLNLTVINSLDSSYDGVWTYKIFYRSKT